eukprot:3124725-Amphidinium_carterae.1
MDEQYANGLGCAAQQRDEQHAHLVDQVIGQWSLLSLLLQLQACLLTNRGAALLLLDVLSHSSHDRKPIAHGRARAFHIFYHSISTGIFKAILRMVMKSSMEGSCLWSCGSGTSSSALKGLFVGSLCGLSLIHISEPTRPRLI